MKKETRQAYNKYITETAHLNEMPVGDVNTKFSVTPTVQQKLEQKVQLSSDFLQKINIIGVTEQQGEILGLGVASTIASTTDTTAKDRETQDIHNLTKVTYHCQQINYDSHIRYPTLDLWAKFPDFGKKIGDIKAKRMALDRIMMGFNGQQRATTSNRTTYPLLQDVAVGWLKKIETNAPERVVSKDGKNGKSQNKILIGKGQEYQNLDALVMAAVDDLIAEEYQDDTGLVAIMSRELLADKYFPLVNNNDKPSEKISADLIISQKRVGGLPAIRVPYVPKGTVLITRLDNLSIYYQEGAMRRTLVDNAKRDQLEDYVSSNDDYVVECYDCVALLRNIEFKDVDSDTVVSPDMTKETDKATG
ncbi:phage major capsid protein, P2 family [Mergibacter septicus]|uniref:Phage major capsid protein, P2 family n=1 Tax=Mergibacter septicus TaxID=221402 RepID=A0A8E3MGM1_9PAST|nr:phage major capsid protein, P2 family [Mergibacter septicus]AWX15611.1 phage major capsid protein, P2 family [Mergibacter septicus]QDJ13089.1 phage major capsid protein, P2 family [Mergibacter septicus]QDJ14865.1 phage major capsid protein, P2 family [Mergibacter septicus]UTU47707.1 phage major capsid protein, P2 family [Mergibacter septicus]WMR96686.1 phage major capsid protein, P2 family [Mergibacter septicus]